MGSKFIKKKKAPGLMLTSLLDMFTIILIFLIVSFEAEDHEFKLNPDLKLPESSARSVFKPAVNIALTPQGLIVEKKVVVKFENGKLPATYYAQDDIPELEALLNKVYDIKFSDATAEELSAEDGGAIMLIQADKNVDYRTLFLILKTAGRAGFVKYRLAVMKK